MQISFISYFTNECRLAAWINPSSCVAPHFSCRLKQKIFFLDSTWLRRVLKVCFWLLHGNWTWTWDMRRDKHYLLRCGYFSPSSLVLQGMHHKSWAMLSCSHPAQTKPLFPALTVQYYMKPLIMPYLKKGNRDTWDGHSNYLFCDRRYLFRAKHDILITTRS